MLMIEFVNHIELLARITEKVWRISTARRLTAHCLTTWNVSMPFKCLLRYLAPPQSARGSVSPKENIHGCHLQKYPATLKLEDKWMVCGFNCLLTPSSVRI